MWNFVTFVLNTLPIWTFPLKGKMFKDRGTFVELRNGLVNISPIGRNCN